MSTLSPDTIAAMSGGQMSPEMVKVATDMMKQLSPEDMERMVNLASTSQMPTPGEVPFGGTPLSTATDTTSAVPSTSRSASDFSTSGLRATPEASLRSGIQTPGTNMPSMADFSPEMQEQMRKQMKDPATKQVGVYFIAGFVFDSVVLGQNSPTSDAVLCAPSFLWAPLWAPINIFGRIVFLGLILVYCWQFLEARNVTE